MTTPEQEALNELKMDIQKDLQKTAKEITDSLTEDEENYFKFQCIVQKDIYDYAETLDPNNSAKCL